MKICVATLYNDRYKSIAEETIPNKKEYCLTKGLDFICKTEGFSIDLGFEKILLLIDLISSKKYDWIYWCGCDTLITNFNLKLDDFIDENFHLIATTDSHGFNSDSFLIKSSPESLLFCNSVMGLFDKYNRVGQCAMEQDAMNELFSDRFSHFVKFLPQRAFNSYLYDLYVHMKEYSERKDLFGNIGEWASGDFLLHIPGISLDRKLSILKDYKQKIIM